MHTSPTHDTISTTLSVKKWVDYTVNDAPGAYSKISARLWGAYSAGVVYQAGALIELSSEN